MRNPLFKIFVIWASLAAHGMGQLALDPGANPYLKINGAYVKSLPPPDGWDVTVLFDTAVDVGSVNNITNYSLRQVAPELGAKRNGGVLEDLDKDGDLDMVFALPSCQIVAYKNIGSASLPRYAPGPQVLATVYRLFPTGSVLSGWSVTVRFGDIDNDGKRDMICGDEFDGEVTCFFRTGQAAWPTTADYGPQKSVLVRYQQGGTGVPIEVSEDGNGTDLAAVNVALEDLNGDQIPDLVVGDPYSPWGPPVNISIYRGTGVMQGGSPVFEAPIVPLAGGSPIQIDNSYQGAVCPVIHDIDGDGKLDLLVSKSNGTILTYKNIGSGTNPTASDFGMPSYAAGVVLNDVVTGQPLQFGPMSALTIADFSKDGDPDLIVVSRDAGSIEENRFRVMENMGPAGLNFTGRPNTIIVGDSKPELRATYTSKAAYFDFDKDEKMDVLYAGDVFGLAIAYSLDQGNSHLPTFSAPVVLPMNESMRNLLSEGVPDMVDFNGDRVLEPLVDGVLVGTVTNLYFMKFKGLLANGLPDFADPVSILPFAFPALHYIQPAVGDINGDGKLDVVIGTGTLYAGESRNLRVMLNSASNAFTLAAPTDFLVGGASTNTVMFPEIVDFDGDNDQDLLVSDKSTSFNRRVIGNGTVRFLRNNSGSFSNQGLIQTTTGQQISVSADVSPRTVDFDFDGKKDLMLSVQNSSVVPLLTKSAAGVPGLAPADPSPSLLISATLPISAKIDSSRRNLTLRYRDIAAVGNIIDFNDLFVNGERCAILGTRLADYKGDADGDGILDVWEETIINANPGDTIVDPDSMKPGDDYDGDGYSNLAEFLAGTDPTDPASHGDLLPDKGQIMWLNADKGNLELVYPGGVPVANTPPWKVKTASDRSGLGNNALGLGTYPDLATGYRGTGAIDHVSVGDSLKVQNLQGSINEFTLLMFIEPRLANLTGMVPIVSNGAAVDPFGISLDVGSGFLKVTHSPTSFISNGTSDLTGQKTKLTSRSFFTIAYSFKNGLGKIYVNGRLAASKAGLATPSAWSGLTIGGGRGFSGSEYLCYNRQLGDLDIRKFDDFVVRKYKMAADQDRDGLVDEWEIAKWGDTAHDRLSEGYDSQQVTITITEPAGDPVE